MNTLHLPSKRSPRSVSIPLGLALAYLAGACSGGGGGAGGQAPATIGGLSSGGWLGTLDPVAGELTSTTGLGVSGLIGIANLAMDSAAKRLYGYDYLRNALFSIDLAGHAVELCQPTSELKDIEWDSNRARVVSTLGLTATTDTLVRLDLATGALEPVGTCASVICTAFDPELDRLYGLTLARELVLIDASNGNSSVVVLNPALAGIEGLAFDAQQRRLFGVRENTVLEIDPFSGDPTVLEELGNVLWDIAIDSQSGLRYGIGKGPELLQLPAEGSGPPGGPIASLGRELAHFTFDALDGRLFAVDTAKNVLVKLDPDTGACEPIGQLDGVKLRTLVFDSVPRELYGIDETTRKLVRVDPEDATATLLDGWVFYPGTNLAIDPETGTIWGYELERNVGLIVDPTGPSAQIVSINLIGSPQEKFFVNDMAFDPVRQELVAVGFVKLDQGGGSFTFHDTLFRFDPLASGSQIYLLGDAPFEGTGLDRDPATGEYTLYVPQQPLFRLTLSPADEVEYRTLDGVWQRDYLATVDVPELGLIYAVDAKYLFRIDPATGSTRLMGPQVQNQVADDLLWNAMHQRLGYRAGDTLRWVDPEQPNVLLGLFELQEDYDAVVGNPATPELVYGLREGATWLENTSAKTRVELSNGAPKAVHLEQATLIGDTIRAVDLGRRTWSIATSGAEWMQTGDTAFELQGLYER